MVLAASVVLCAALVAWVVATHTPKADTPEAPPHHAAAPLPPAPPVRFPDGSFAELHGDSSRVFTEEFSSERVRLRLVGGARFNVAPHPERSFAVSSGRVVVRALGTLFAVDPEGLRTRVSVERGRVQVMWQSGATLLAAGSSAIFPPIDEPVLRPLPARGASATP